MSFTPKDWRDNPETTTPINALALEDIETRLSDYTDEQAGGGFSVTTYGAVGNGTADDSPAIQDAIDAAEAAGGGIVRFPPAVYALAGSGSTRTYPSVGATTYEYCLSIPSDVILDLRGATLKLKAAENVVMLTNSAATNTNIGIVGFGLLDGNDVALTAKPLVWLEGVTDLELDLRMKDTYHLGLYVVDCVRVDAPRIYSLGCTGEPIYLGSPTASVIDSRIGVIDSRNTVGDPANLVNFPGNPVYSVLENSTIDTIRADTTAGGVKIDRPSVDVQIGKVLGYEGQEDNSGFKLQGDGSGYPLRVDVGLVHMTNQDGPGLYMEQCVDCSVATYVGRNNGRNNTYPDVWIGGIRDRIGSINSRACGIGSVLFRDTADDAQIGAIQITDPNVSNTGTTSGISVGDATGHIGSLIANDSTSHMYRAITYTDTDAVVTIGQLKSTGHTSATWQPAGAKMWAKSFVRGTTEYLQVVATEDALNQRSSTATLSVNDNSEVIEVTGTANITSISTTYVGHIMVLRFTGAASGTGLTDGSNLKLAGNFVYTADDTVTLLCDGTNWVELARSVN